MHTYHCAISTLFEYLAYDPATGVLRWRFDHRGSARAGDVAGSITRLGYRIIKIQQVRYFAHRIVWAMHHGAWPVLEIDHRDGQRTRNVITNLRQATRSQNCKNVAAKGYRFEADRGKWLARIKANGRQINLGRFATEAEAAAAYETAKRIYFGEFARANN